jgi:predicted dehydrogenase
MKIGLMSFAHMHAYSYATCLQNLPGVALAGIYDDEAERRQRMGEAFNAPTFTEAQALLDLGLEGVIICAENAHHRPLVELAAGQTGYILCEKPIATTLEDAQAMIDICAARHTRLQVAFPVRFAAPIQRLKAMLDEGVLGRIFSAKCTNHGRMPGGWFIEPALSGGGAVIDHTVHVIDLLRWFWQTEVVEVYAEIGYGLFHPGLGIDDAGLLSFKLANGVYGTLDTSWSRPKSYPTWGDVKIDLVGESGRIQVDAFSQSLAVSANSAGKTEWIPWGSNADQGLINDFTGMIRANREPFISGWDGLKALEVALAAYESARTGRPVSLKATEVAPGGLAAAKPACAG